MKKLPLIFSQLVLLLILVITSIAPASAKVASGLQELGAGLHQGQTPVESLLRLGLGVSSYDGVSGSSLVPKGAGKSIKDQAADLVPANANKNRVTLRYDKQQLEIDLAGKDHAGIPTPHTKVSPRNTRAPDHLQPAYNTSERKSTLRPSTQQDIRTARRYLERQNR
ncbi:hypothetical protein AB835_14415 [Candidatus Endobugula sertula]|uniref:Uncharacterized protein n=1 Tax=Candidatus Endobugula sertula TaxID=62101 RepID=A0A1D2QLE3_9GAMM|nr:hypothetical protein AB835_14415 [Candidatus Endobugula sertula]